jgi:RNA polymerase subunit RPABC4/transcription elongation factor Spt4
MQLSINRNSREEIVNIFDALFGCWHQHISFPQTSKPGQRRCEAATQTGTYVVCLDCGTEFAYDWKNMRVLSPNEKTSFARARVEVEANG